MAADRDRLVEQHLSLVQAIAAKLKRSLGRSIEFDDLVGYGTKGLLEAAERFDPTQGATFTTFAYYRIRGAMLDGLRTMGWYSRADYAPRSEIGRDLACPVAPENRRDLGFIAAPRSRPGSPDRAPLG